MARDVVRRIYVKYFNSTSKDFDIVKNVFGKISSIIKAELNRESFNRELLSCVKVHLWRKIKYNTQIQVNEKLISNSLSKK